MNDTLLQLVANAVPGELLARSSMNLGCDEYLLEPTLSSLLAGANIAALCRLGDKLVDEALDKVGSFDVGELWYMPPTFFSNRHPCYSTHKAQLAGRHGIWLGTANMH